MAAEKSHVAAMEFLVAHGADLNAKDKVRAPLGSSMTYGGKKRGSKSAAVLEGLS